MRTIGVEAAAMRRQIADFRLRIVDYPNPSVPERIVSPGESHFAATVARCSALPIPPLTVCENFVDLPLGTMRRGIVFLLARWSRPSIQNLRQLTETIGRLGATKLSVCVTDLDSIPADKLASLFGTNAPAGFAETLWIRDGEVEQATLAHPGGEAEMARRIRTLLEA